MVKYLHRKRSPPPVSQLLLWTLIIFSSIVILSLIYIDQKIRPSLMDIAEMKTIEFATRTINAAVKSTEKMEFDQLVEIQFDNNGNVATLGWNSEAVNQALRSATERAEYFLYGMNKGTYISDDNADEEESLSVDEYVEKDPTVIEIPIGSATGNTILANLGPKIPVHFEIVGSLRSDVIHEVKEFGVNAALIEIYIPVTVNIQIVIPFSTTATEVSTRVFIDSRVIMGEVPEFYNSSSDPNGPSISIPKD